MVRCRGHAIVDKRKSFAGERGIYTIQGPAIRDIHFVSLFTSNKYIINIIANKYHLFNRGDIHKKTNKYYSKKRNGYPKER
mgnify:CR=1 FL=1